MKTFPQTVFTEVEFDVVRQRASEYAVTLSAKKKLGQLVPFATPEDAQEALHEVNEILGLYEADMAVPALAATEVDEIFLRLKVRNAILEPEEFLQIKDLVGSFNNLHRFIHAQKEVVPHVIQYFLYAQPNKEIPVEVDRVFDIRGEINSNASPELANIRHQLVRKRAAADRLFYKVLKRYQAAGYLGEISETVQQDRRVLAVNAAYKSKAKGIFHGRSAKQTLLFIEPQETIEINNEIAMLLDEEQHEIKSILKLLTAFIARFREELIAFTHVIRTIDFINAKARFAYREKSVLPKLSALPEVDIIDGINPVLRFFNQPKKKSVVPLHVKLNAEQRILVISGPNAGGKSITLKTVGLLQLMIQSGMLVTANPRSTFGWFNLLMVDIGDAQSIENELSTYSSKLSKMTSILQDAMPDSLVLIDEFGSGSDPELGGALAQVFLEELNKIKAVGVLTTHYNSIKALADKLPGVCNASMEFNSKTFSPEYILNTGTPGSSYTFEVAQRVGIHHTLINRARQKLDKRTVDIDKLLVAVQGEKNLLAAAREKMQTELAELNALKNKHTGRIKILETKLQKAQENQQKIQTTLQWGKRFESLVASYVKFKSAKKKKEITERFLKMLGEHAGDVEKEMKTAVKKEDRRKAAKLKKQLSEPIALGDKIRLLVTKQRGTVAEIKKDKYLIALGGNISTTVTRDKFVKDYSG